MNKKRALGLIILLVTLSTLIVIPFIPAQEPLALDGNEASPPDPIDFQETPNYIRIDNGLTFIIEFYKDSAGYNKIYYRNGSVLVHDDRVSVEYFTGNKWKQRGTPTDLSWVKLNDGHYEVTRHYKDYLGTAFNVTYSVKVGYPIKITVDLDSGQTDEYRISWALSGITSGEYSPGTNKAIFGDDGTDVQLAFDWSDAYQEFGDIAIASVETQANGKKLTINFEIGVVEDGQTLTLDPVIIDYNDEEYTAGIDMAILHPSSTVKTSAISQSFTTPDNVYSLTSVKFKLRREGSPTGNAYAKLYAHTGTYGTSSEPTGEVLAISGPLNVAGVTDVWLGAFYEFTFTGVEQYEMQANTQYVIVYENPTSGNIDVDNYIHLIANNQEKHDGNWARFYSSDWFSTSNTDCNFYVYGTLGTEEESDWLTGWEYRKYHEIVGTIEGAQTDYYMPIKVNYGQVGYFAENGEHAPAPKGAYYNGKTYIGWQGDSGYDPYIICYDHATNTYSDAVKIGTNPLEDDSHGAPIIIIDESGYLHVFYGSHVSNLKYAKSDNPEDITAWTAQDDPVTDCTYPQIIADNGKMHLFYRDTPIAQLGPRVYRLSEDNGASWGAMQVIIEREDEGDGIYGRYEIKYGNKIHTIWIYYDTVQRNNVYHAYLDLTDGHMYTITGTDLGTSISEAEGDANCKIVDSGGNRVTHLEMKLDGDGYPYIMYSIATGVGDDVDLRFIRWTGSEWTASESITETDHPANTMAFILHSATSITCFLVGSGEAGSGGDIEKWTWNGSDWTKIKTILSETDAEKPLAYPRTPVNNHEDLQFIFSQWGGLGVGDLKVYASDGDGLISGEFEDIGANVYCHESCRADFGDIRFTQSDGTTLIIPWLEEKVNSDYALFWVPVPSIPAYPGVATIYMYYGNAEAEDNSAEAREDFTTFTEVEEVDHIQKTEYHVDFLDMRDRTTYLYKDYGANNFGDYAEHLNFKRVTHADGSIIESIMFSNMVGGYMELAAVDAPLIAVGTSGTDPRITMSERDSDGDGHVCDPTHIDITRNVMYYLAIRKYGTSLVLDTYSTAILRHAGGDGDIGHQTLTLTTDYAFSINYVGNTLDNSEGKTGTSDFESLFFRKYVEAEPTHGIWGEEGGIPELDIINIVADEWVFEGKNRYRFEVAYTNKTLSNVNQVGMQFTDDIGDVHSIWYDGAANRLTVTSPNDGISGWLSTLEQDGDDVLATFQIMFNKNIPDTYNITIYGRIVTNIDTGWQATTGDIFNIYNLGGLSTLVASGTAGRVTGGDVFELYAADTRTRNIVPLEDFDVRYVPLSEGSQILGIQITPAEDEQALLDEINAIIFMDSRSENHTIYPTNRVDSTWAPPTKTYISYPFGLRIYDNPRSLGRIMFLEKEFFRKISASESELVTVSFYAMTPLTSGTTGRIAVSEKGYYPVHAFGGANPDRAANIYFNGNGDLRAADGGGWVSLCAYEGETWYNITMILDPSTLTYDVYVDDALEGDDLDFQDGGDVGSLGFVSFLQNLWAPSGNYTDMYVDDVWVHTNFTTDYGGVAKATMLFKHLQHWSMDFDFFVEDGEIYAQGASGTPRIADDDYSNLGYLEFGWDVMLNETWVTDFLVARISITDGYITGKNNWIQFNVTWYKQGDYIKNDYLYGLFEGYSIFPGSAKDTCGWHWDIWFNRVNASTVVGARLNTEYFGMSDKSVWWAVWSSNWQPMRTEVSESTVFINLDDVNGTTRSAKDVLFVLSGVKVYRNTEAQFAYKVLNIAGLDFMVATDTMSGIDTPPSRDTVVPDVMSGFFGSALGSIFTAALRRLSNTLAGLGLGLFTLSIAFIDNIFAALGYPALVSTIFVWMDSLFSSVPILVGYGITFIGQIFTLISTSAGNTLNQLSGIITIWIGMYSSVMDLFTGILTPGINLWNDLGINSFIRIAAVLYPFWLLMMGMDKGAQAVFDHINGVLNIGSFFLNFILNVAGFFMGLMDMLIGAIRG